MLGIFMTILFLFGAFSVKGESYFWSIVSFSVFFWFVGVLIGEISQPPPKPEPEPELEPEPEPEPDPSLSLRERIEEIKKRTRN